MNSSDEVQFVPVETKKASQLIFEHIRSLILRGDLQVGDALPAERIMMKQFQRSHPTVREALRMLEAAGLVTVKPGNSTVVSDLKDNPIEKPLDELFRYQEITQREVLEFMAAIAPDVAVLSADRRGQETITFLEVELSHIEKREDLEIRDILPFQNKIVAGAGNYLIQAVWEALGAIIVRGSADERVLLFSHEKHEYIIECLHAQLRALRNRNHKEAAIRTQVCWQEWLDMDKSLAYVGRAVKPGVIINSDSDSLSTEFKPVKTEKVSEALFRQIREKILTGELQPGDKLPPERRLMEMFGRSRPTIREALRMLESRHYIRTLPGSGTVVSRFTTQAAERSLQDLIEMNKVDQQDLLELRNICETVIVSWAAERRTDSDITSLEAIMEEVEHFVDRVDDSMAMGHRFNLILARSSGNRAAYMVNRAVSEVNYRMVQHNWKAAADKTSMAEMIRHSKNIWKQHSRIFQAVLNGNSVAAREATLDHIKAATGSVM